MIVITNRNYFPENELLYQDVAKSFHFEREVDVNIRELFDSMTDIKNYPLVLPENFVSVRIINQSENVWGGMNTFAETEVSEAGVRATLPVKHTTKPYEMHTLEILGGDADRTTVSQTFTETNSGTKITSDVVIRVKGILYPFGLLPNHNLEHAMNTAIDKFVEYTKSK